MLCNPRVKSKGRKKTATRKCITGHTLRNIWIVGVLQGLQARMSQRRHKSQPVAQKSLRWSCWSCQCYVFWLMQYLLSWESEFKVDKFLPSAWKAKYFISFLGIFTFGRWKPFLNAYLESLSVWYFFSNWNFSKIQTCKKYKFSKKSNIQKIVNISKNFKSSIKIKIFKKLNFSKKFKFFFLLLNSTYLALLW